MTQRDRIFAVIEAKGWISNRDFAGMGLLHIGRNRLTEESARVYFGGNKKYVVFVKGETFMDNKWELRDIVQEENTATVKVSCLKCGFVFDARARDVKEGHGRYCSRSCSGGVGGKRRHELSGLARPTEAAQMALL